MFAPSVSGVAEGAAPVEFRLVGAIVAEGLTMLSVAKGTMEDSPSVGRTVLTVPTVAGALVGESVGVMVDDARVSAKIPAEAASPLVVDAEAVFPEAEAVLLAEPDPETGAAAATGALVVVEVFEGDCAKTPGATALALAVEVETEDRGTEGAAGAKVEVVESADGELIGAAFTTGARVEAVENVEGGLATVRIDEVCVEVQEDQDVSP